MDKLKVCVNDGDGVQLEWHGILLTLRLNEHYGIAGSLAENRGGKISLLTFHGTSPENPLPLALHEETMSADAGAR